MPQSLPADDNLFPQPGLTCTITIPGSPIPFVRDCIEAYKKIGHPQCTPIIRYLYDYITVGTCTVLTYSENGLATCPDPDFIRRSVRIILDKCTNGEKVQGSFTWTSKSSPREGVKLIRSASQEWVFREGLIKILSWAHIYWLNKTIYSIFSTGTQYSIFKSGISQIF